MLWVFKCQYYPTHSFILTFSCNKKMLEKNIFTVLHKGTLFRYFLFDFLPGIYYLADCNPLES
jgi:hypothetical protein